MSHIVDEQTPPVSEQREPDDYALYCGGRYRPRPHPEREGMSAVTTDEVVNALVDLAREIVNAGPPGTRVALNGDQAIGVIANKLLDVAKRLRDGAYGP